MKLLLTLLGCSLLLSGSACQTQVRHTVAREQTITPTTSLPLRAFEVVEEGRVVGVVVEFSEADGERRFFSVRNHLQQEFGVVDLHGRAWRYHPHRQDEPEWLGTGTVRDGVIRILELRGECELFEVDLGQLVTPDPPLRESVE